MSVREEFKTKEGVYKNLRRFRYSKPRGLPLLGKELSKTRTNVVSVKDMEGLSEWILFNSGREFYCYPFYGIEKSPDLLHPVDKHSYRAAFPLCHDVNQCTRSVDNLDLVIGFNDGPLQRINPISKSSIAIYNNDRNMDHSDVTCVKWVPGSENQFVSSHMSGNMLVWTIEEHYKTSNIPTLVEYKKINDTTIYICKPKHKFPLQYRWTIGHGPITALAFSPDTHHLAVASQDGFLRVYDFHKMEFYSKMRSYFGGFLCVCWSPDGKYVVTGGEDDLLSVWSFNEKCIVTRGEGHQSYVNSVMFDPYTSDLQKSGWSETDLGGTVSATELKSQRSSRFFEESESYRVGSVGQDGIMCLWELSSDNLTLPKRGLSRINRTLSKQSSAAVQHEGEVDCKVVESRPSAGEIQNNIKLNKEDDDDVEMMSPLADQEDETDTPSHVKGKKKKKDKHSKSITKSTVRKVKNFVYGSESTGHRHINVFESCHSDDSAPSMSEINVIEPLVAKKICSERLTDIIFREDCLLISTEDGYVQLWSRPGYDEPIHSGINSPKSRVTEQKHTSV